VAYPSFSQELLQELCDRADLVSVISGSVELKKAGKDYSALCPFHAEKSPSFTVSPAKQFYHCFGCGAHGNVIEFYVKYTGMSFVEAVEKLAREQGRVLPSIDRELTPEADEKEKRKQILSDVLKKAMRLYYGNLRSHPFAVDYIKGRGIDKQTVMTFGIGYAHNHDIVEHFKGTPTDVLVEAGLLTANEETGEVYDKFRRRLMFPIHNERGNVIAFGGRVLNDDLPKYLNSPESLIFQKGEELFGLYFAKAEIRKRRSAILFEGYMDVIMLHQYGCLNTVAALGTSMSEQQLNRLFRLADELIFCFDGDRAGVAAADRAARLALIAISDGKSAKFLQLPDDHDPDSFVRNHGIDQWNALLNDAPPLSQKILSILFSGKDISLPETAAAVAKEATALLKTIKNAPLFASALKAGIESRLGFYLHQARLSSAPQTMSAPQEIPFDAGRTAFYELLAALSALGVNVNECVANEQLDQFALLIIGWFQFAPKTIDAQIEHNATTSISLLKKTIDGALQTLRQRLSVLPDTQENTQREIAALVNALNREFERTQAVQRAKALFE